MTNLIDAIKRAKESIKDLDLDDVEKQVAMSKAIDYFLNESNTRPNLKVEIPAQVFSNSDQNGGGNDFWAKLKIASGIEVEKLKDIYSIKDKQIRLVVSSIKGEKKPEQQYNFALAIIFAYMNGLEMEWVPTGLLSESAKDFGVYDSNFSTNLERRGNSFRKDGSGKGLKYRLSGIGIAEAKNYLLSL